MVQSGQLVIIYGDNGCGMTEDQAKRVFEPFFTTKRGQGGSGLGLHLVYNLVTTTLRGRIEFRTAVGAGLQFTLWLPLGRESTDV